MAVVHKKNSDGTDADKATIAWYTRYTERGVRGDIQSTTDVPATSRAMADEAQPSTSAVATAPTKRRRRSTKPAAAAFETPESQPTDVPFDLADDLIPSTSLSDADDYIVDVTDEDPADAQMTRPVPPPRRVAEIQAAAVTRPTAPTVPAAKRRRLEMAPSVLAQPVIANPDKRSRDVVEDLANRYSLTPVEQRDRVNVVRGMRTMAAAFSTRIRRPMPLNRTDADVQQFLTVVKTKCRRTERNVSDEFTN